MYSDDDDDANAMDSDQNAGDEFVEFQRWLDARAAETPTTSAPPKVAGAESKPAFSPVHDAHGKCIECGYTECKCHLVYQLKIWNDWSQTLCAFNTGISWGVEPAMSSSSALCHFTEFPPVPWLKLRYPDGQATQRTSEDDPG